MEILDEAPLSAEGVNGHHGGMVRAYCFAEREVAEAIVTGQHFADTNESAGVDIQGCGELFGGIGIHGIEAAGEKGKALTLMWWKTAESIDEMLICGEGRVTGCVAIQVVALLEAYRPRLTDFFDRHPADDHLADTSNIHGCYSLLRIGEVLKKIAKVNVAISFRKG